MSADLSSFRGTRIYLDTMMPYAFLRGVEAEIRLLFDRIERGEITAHTSVLTLDELAYRLLLALVRDRYDDSPLDRLRSDEARLVSEFYPVLLPRLADLAAFPNLSVESIGLADWAVASQVMERYGLRPRDALHVATMERLGCLDLASNDDHFDRVPGIRRFYTQ